MKKASILITLILSFKVGLPQTEADLFKLGVSIDSVSRCNKCEDISVLFEHGGRKSGLRCLINEYIFDIIYSDERKVIAYYTTENNFLVRNFRYLTNDKKVLDSIKREKVIFSDLFQGAYINLPDGWRLGFTEQSVIKKNGRRYLRRTATPYYLYKTSIITEFSESKNTLRNK